MPPGDEQATVQAHRRWVWASTTLTSAGRSSFCCSTNPNLRLSLYRLLFSCCHLRAETGGQGGERVCQANTAVAALALLATTRRTFLLQRRLVRLLIHGLVGVHLRRRVRQPRARRRQRHARQAAWRLHGLLRRPLHSLSVPRPVPPSRGCHPRSPSLLSAASKRLCGGAPEC